MNPGAVTVERDGRVVRVVNRTVILIVGGPAFTEPTSERLHAIATCLEVATTGAAALSALRLAGAATAVVIIGDGIADVAPDALCAEAKRISPHCRVVFATEQMNDAVVAEAFACGADDVVVGASAIEYGLVARTRAQIDAITPSRSSQLEAGGITIDVERYEVRARGHMVALTLTQFRLLEFLVRHADTVVTPSQISGALALEIEVETSAVRSHVYLLRKHLGEAGQIIETVRGLGYRVRRDQTNR